jgi:hypothetical protein
MRQQLGARHRGRRPGLLATGVRHRSRGILTQCLIDGLAQRKWFLRSGRQSPHAKQKGEAQRVIKASNHWSNPLGSCIPMNKVMNDEVRYKKYELICTRPLHPFPDDLQSHR